MSDAGDEFGRLRAAIDMNDRVIVAAVERAVPARTELWRLKRELGVDRCDAATASRVCAAALAAANGGPLSAAGLERLVTELLALTKDELGRRLRDVALGSTSPRRPLPRRPLPRRPLPRRGVSSSSSVLANSSAETVSRKRRKSSGSRSASEWPGAVTRSRRRRLRTRHPTPRSHRRRRRSCSGP